MNPSDAPRFDRVNDDALEAFRARMFAIGLPGEKVAEEITNAGRSYYAGLRMCESPIEAMLLRTLLLADFGLPMGAPRVHVDHRALVPEGDIVIAPQMVFCGYRLDFAVLRRLPSSIRVYAIECDGAEFHAARPDVIRDGVLASWGIRTIRLTGRVINRSAYAAATVVARAIQHDDQTGGATW